MICDVCHGQGYVDRRKVPEAQWMVPICPECGGSGVTHCCRGDQPSERDKEVADDQDA